MICITGYTIFNVRIFYTGTGDDMAHADLRIIELLLSHRINLCFVVLASEFVWAYGLAVELINIESAALHVLSLRHPLAYDPFALGLMLQFGFALFAYIV